MLPQMTNPVFIAVLFVISFVIFFLLHFRIDLSIKYPNILTLIRIILFQIRTSRMTTLLTFTNSLRLDFLDRHSTNHPLVSMDICRHLIRTSREVPLHPWVIRIVLHNSLTTIMASQTSHLQQSMITTMVNQGVL